MKIKIICVADGTADKTTDSYINRIGHYLPVEILLLKPAARNVKTDLSFVLKQEEAAIRKALGKDSNWIAMDERGKQFTSHEFANTLQKQMNTGTKNLIFLIGGAYGLPEAIKKEANLILAMSSFTFPHELARIILCEQIYRAMTILKNEKYHH